MTNHYTDVCEATIKSLRQQLVERSATKKDYAIAVLKDHQLHYSDDSDKHFIQIWIDDLTDHTEELK